MYTNQLVKLFFGRAVVITLISLVASTANAQTTATVKVKCHHGQKISQALKHHPNVDNLIVEIDGMCNENVILTRDRVTLRGLDPTRDGIQAVVNTNPIDAALWVRGAHLVTVENLKLTGGFAGLLATEVSTPQLRMVNCRLQDNTTYGAQLEAALLQAEDTVFNSNGFINAGVFQGSRFQCTRCTLADPGGGIGPAIRTNLLALTGSSIVVGDTTVSNGGISSTASSLLIIDSTISGFAPNGASISDIQSTVNFNRVQISGSMIFNSGSNAQLFGVTQTTAAFPNSLDNSSFVRIGDASPATGGPPTIPSSVLGFTLRNFSNGSLQQTSQINGNLSCTQGSNAFCANLANISGTSNCTLCPKP
jgi:hypothetical protein